MIESELNINVCLPTSQGHLTDKDTRASQEICRIS